MERSTVILLGAGKGTRMGSGVRKQYMELDGMPLLAYSLKTFTECPFLTDIVMIIPEGEEEYVRRHIIDAVPGAEEKIRALVPGGSERYGSVYNGIRAIDWPCGYVFIHDGARPFIDRASLERLYEAVRKEGAVIAGMPSKDTVRITDADGYSDTTPDRSRVWIIQTPQVFEKQLITDAYEGMMRALPELERQGVKITDDGQAVEQILGKKVRMVEASYRNIKITTPEDLLTAKAFTEENV